jgi:hypothetical protein
LVVDALLRLKEYSGGKPVYPTLASSPVKLETGLPAPSLTQNSALVDDLLDNGADGIIWFSHVFENGSYVTDRYPLTDAGQQDGTADMVRSVNQQVREHFGLSN